MLDAAAALNRRRQILRIVLMGIIVLTLPFYCLGFYLWGTAPQARPIATTQPASNTPLGGEQASLTPSPTSTIPLFATATLPLAPTPGQFIPLPTSVIPTSFVPPTATVAPSLTFPPTNTHTHTPTATFTPPPTLVPPSDTPTATATLTATPTHTATATEFILIPPSDTPSSP
jgi:hypothetical protein